MFVAGKPKLKVKSDADLISDLTPKSSDRSAKKNPFKAAKPKTPASGQGSKVFDRLERRQRAPAAASPFESVQKKTKIMKTKKRVRELQSIFLVKNVVQFPLYSRRLQVRFSSGCSGRRSTKTRRALREACDVDQLDIVTLDSTVGVFRAATKRVKSGFDLWFAENEADLRDEYANLAHEDVVVEAAKNFQQLRADEKQVRAE